MVERRSPKPEVVGSSPSTPAKHWKIFLMKKVIEFVREVKSEVSKVTWATRKDTVMTTISILFMVFLAAIFFLLIDWIFSSLIKVIF